MVNPGVISERIDALRLLSNKSEIFLNDLREEFRQDLQNFIVGETLTVSRGEVAIGNNLYRQWLSKIRTKGFDYEIDFKK